MTPKKQQYLHKRVRKLEVQVLKLLSDNRYLLGDMSLTESCGCAFAFELGRLGKDEAFEQLLSDWDDAIRTESARART